MHFILMGAKRKLFPRRQAFNAQLYIVIRRGFIVVIRIVCLFDFLTSSSTTRLYRVRVPRQCYMLPHTRQRRETITSASASHIILTLTQLVGSGWPQRESNPRPPHQESPALLTELPCPPCH